jgi:CRP/FNR family transcriptional regulator, cyclic AMP receptor protein
MITTRMLRFFSFFGDLDEKQLLAIASIAEEENLEKGVILFVEGDPAKALYFLESGSIDLFYSNKEKQNNGNLTGIPVGEINPGEPFSISSLIEPHVLTSTAWVAKPSRVLKIDAKKLRKLFKSDKQLAQNLMRRIARVAIERLYYARIQLAAAWA